MGFRAKTFDLGSRERLVRAWTTIANELRNQPEVWLPPPTGKTAGAFLIEMNRVRAAMRAQYADGGQCDHIKAEVAEREGGKVVVFTDRADGTQKLVLRRTDGTTVPIE